MAIRNNLFSKPLWIIRFKIIERFSTIKRNIEFEFVLDYDSYEECTMELRTNVGDRIRLVFSLTQTNIEKEVLSFDYSDEESLISSTSSCLKIRDVNQTFDIVFRWILTLDFGFRTTIFEFTIVLVNRIRSILFQRVTSFI